MAKNHYELGDRPKNMNNPSRRAGQSTRDMAAKRYKNRARFVLLTMGIVLLVLLAALNSKVLGIGSSLIGLLIVARLILDFSDIQTQRMLKAERRAIRGAKGEEAVGSILASLGDNYLIINDVASTNGNIDHIVISKESGIFLIETKAHGGKVSVNNGRLLVNARDPEKDFIAQVLHNTYWLREQIRLAVNVEPWITPILVFTNAFIEPSAPIKGVKIVNKKFLLNLLRRPDKKPQNLAIWENREKILKELCA